MLAGLGSADGGTASPPTPEAVASPIAFINLSVAPVPSLRRRTRTSMFSGEPFHDSVPLRKTRTTLEDEVVSEGGSQHVQNLANPVLLDRGRADSQLFGDRVERWSEFLGVGETSHRSTSERGIMTDRLTSSWAHDAGGVRTTSSRPAGVEAAHATSRRPVAEAREGVRRP